MKSPPNLNEECDDIFGPPRSYPMDYSPPKNRPSMISAKYKQKEERRKILKICTQKIKKIDDPDINLYRAVLINNTLKKLQREAREEKSQKQQCHYPRCYSNESYLNLKNEFIKNEIRQSTNYEEQQTFPAEETFVVENDFDAKLAEEINQVNAKDMEVLGSIVEENLNSLNPTYQDNGNPSGENADTQCMFSARKRSFDDMDDCDVQEVLSQFYMPPTPRMLTCIDEDDEGSVTVESAPKRLKVEVTPVEEKSNNLSVPSGADQMDCEKCSTDFSNNFLSDTIPAQDSRLRYLNNQNVDTDSNSYSCGHASMFSELQSNVYHNLIASLET